MCVCIVCPWCVCQPSVLVLWNGVQCNTRREVFQCLLDISDKRSTSRGDISGVELVECLQLLYTRMLLTMLEVQV